MYPSRQVMTEGRNSATQFDMTAKGGEGVQKVQGGEEPAGQLLGQFQELGSTTYPGLKYIPLMFYSLVALMQDCS